MQSQAGCVERHACRNSSWAENRRGERGEPSVLLVHGGRVPVAAKGRFIKEHCDLKTDYGGWMGWGYKNTNDLRGGSRLGFLKGTVSIKAALALIANCGAAAHDAISPYIASNDQLSKAGRKAQDATAGMKAVKNNNNKKTNSNGDTLTRPVRVRDIQGGLSQNSRDENSGRQRQTAQKMSNVRDAACLK